MIIGYGGRSGSSNILHVAVLLFQSLDIVSEVCSWKETVPTFTYLASYEMVFWTTASLFIRCQVSCNIHFLLDKVPNAQKKKGEKGWVYSSSWSVLAQVSNAEWLCLTSRVAHWPPSSPSRVKFGEIFSLGSETSCWKWPRWHREVDARMSHVLFNMRCERSWLADVWLVCWILVFPYYCRNLSSTKWSHCFWSDLDTTQLYLFSVFHVYRIRMHL